MRERPTIEGYQALNLENAHIGLTVIPALGARVVSLRSIRSKHEWLWRPGDGRGLFASARGTPFENSPLAGIDECLPTVAPCSQNGSELPDHGEAWASEWQGNATEFDSGAIETRLALRALPLKFTRRISLDGAEARFAYTLRNSGPRAVRYIWALHPLLKWTPEDRVELDGESEAIVAAARSPRLAPGDRGPWPAIAPGVRLDRGDLGAETDCYSKAFLATRQARNIALVSREPNERLTFRVDPSEVPNWGYWLTRRGWHGHTHLVLEPTNAPADAPADLPSDQPAWTLQPGERRSWEVGIDVR